MANALLRTGIGIGIVLQGRYSGLGSFLTFVCLLGLVIPRLIRLTAQGNRLILQSETKEEDNGNLPQEQKDE